MTDQLEDSSQIIKNITANSWQHELRNELAILQTRTTFGKIVVDERAEARTQLYELKQEYERNKNVPRASPVKAKEVAPSSAASVVSVTAPVLGMKPPGEKYMKLATLVEFKEMVDEYYEVVDKNRCCRAC
jgi:hypothetical protein